MLFARQQVTPEWPQLLPLPRKSQVCPGWGGLPQTRVVFSQLLPTARLPLGLWVETREVLVGGAAAAPAWGEAGPVALQKWLRRGLWWRMEAQGSSPAPLPGSD